MATIHPYKGYLNTEFQLLSQTSEPVSYIISSCDSKTGKIEGVLHPNVPHRVKMPHPGNYEVLFGDNTNARIFIEDGYKFGGGEHKKSFIFDNCPWAFVVMHDRTYFHNRETGEEYVEAISPDKITEVSKDYVLFKNNGQKEETLFSLVDQKPVICASDILFHNPSYLVWSVSNEDNQSKELVIYSINKRAIVLRDGYAYISIDKHNSRIYYANNDRVQSVDVSSDENFAHELLCLKGSFGAFAQISYAVFIETHYSKKELVIYNLATGEVKGRINFSRHISRINDVMFIDLLDRYRSIHEFKLKESDFPEAIISADYIEYDIYPCEEDVFFKETQKQISSDSFGYHEISILKSTGTELSEKIKTCNEAVLTDGFFCIYGPQESVVIPLRYRHRLEHKEIGRIHSYKNKLVLEEDGSYTFLNQYGFWQNRIDKKCNFMYYDDYGIILDQESGEIINNRRLGKFICRESQDGYIKAENALIRPDGTIHWNNSNDRIPSGLSPKFRYGIDSTNNEIYLYKGEYSGFVQTNRILIDLFDSSKYTSVLLSENGHQILYRDEKEFTMYDVETAQKTEFNNLYFISHINGSRPLFRLDEHRQAILVNPITGRPVDFDLISNYQFISPNRELYADSKLEEYIEYYSLITETTIKREEYRELITRLDYSLFITSNEEREKKKEEAIKARKDFISEHQSYFDKLSDEEMKGLLSNPNFVNKIIDIRGIAIIRRIETHEVYRRIPLGPPLQYINYAAFSYDNRYVAIAGCYPLGAGGGLYLVYDLINQSVVCQRMTSRAVWTAAFSKSGAIAAYTSDPVTFFATSETEYSNSVLDENIIKGYNFLSFSPDGKYLACSEQGYIPLWGWNESISESWGHQPSSLVSIRRINDPQKVIVEYNDLSDFAVGKSVGIAGSFNAKSVASISFSNDNKRLMMVGNDGVVIIRNLHLKDNAS